MTEHAHHGPTTKGYISVFIALAILTTLTVAISKTPWSHGLRETLAFVIAGVKALLVALLFMHLRWETKTIVIFAIAPILLMILFMVAISPDIGTAG